MITASELLQRAEILSQQETEIEWRESIKNAYYSVYHTAKYHIEKENIGTEINRNNQGEHQYLLERLRSIDTPLAKSIAREIQMLKDKRVQCCYFLDENISKMMAFQQINTAKKILLRLETLANNA